MALLDDRTGGGPDPQVELTSATDARLGVAAGLHLVVETGAGVEEAELQYVAALARRLVGL